MTDLRNWLLDALTLDTHETYRIASEVRVSSYRLTQYARGECDFDGAELSRLLVALRRRPMRCKPKLRDRRTKPVQTRLI